MAGLTPEQHHRLIQQAGSLLDRLAKIPEGQAREECEAELRELVRKLWIDGGPAE